LKSADSSSYTTSPKLVLWFWKIYVTGRSQASTLLWYWVDTAWSHDVFVAKLDMGTGITDWVQKFWSTSWDWGFWMTLDTNEDILVTWKFTWIANTQWQNITSDWADIFLLKIANNWTFMWELSAGWAWWDIGQWVVVNGSNLYLWWWTASDIDLFGETFTHFNWVDSYLIKMDY
jgi:hypothetical protein